jgi:hypothetical protein
VRNLINSLQFQLRAHFFGKIKLRSGLPKILPAGARRSEIEFYRLLLKQAIGEEGGNQFDSVIDVGCRNWSYVEALAQFFPNADLTGVEVDGWRRYWNLHRRIDQATAYARAVQDERRQARALPIDFRHFELESDFERAALIYFFPFVSENPCLGWGLPARYSNFSSLLQYSLRLFQLHKNRAPWTWISAHQGEWEAEIARESYSNLNFKWIEKQISPEEVKGLWPSQFPTVLFNATLKR